MYNHHQRALLQGQPFNSDNICTGIPGMIGLHQLSLPRPLPSALMPSLQLPLITPNATARRAQLIQLLIMREREIEAQQLHNQSLLMLQQSLTQHQKPPQVLSWQHSLHIKHDRSSTPAVQHGQAEVEIQGREEEPRHSMQGEMMTSTAADAVVKKKVQPSLRLSKSKKNDIKWMLVYARLEAYHARNGDCIVPRGYTQDPRLASWVAEQRKQFKLFKDGKSSSISPERIQMLDKLNFAWSAQETAWTRNLSQLVKFKEYTGHCHVSINDPQFPKLGLWIKEQRRHHTLWKQGRPSHMNATRAAELDRIGFCWDTHEATWSERFKELAKIRKETGSCTACPKGHLSTWIQHQRRQYRKHMEGKASHITEKRIQALESLGFVWYPRDKSKFGSSSQGSYTSSDSDSASDDSVSHTVKRQRVR